MSNCQIEELREEHLAEVMSIYNYYVANSTATFHAHPIDPAEMREIVFFDQPRYRSFILVTEGQIGGYCLLTSFKKREAYDVTAEVTVYLKPDFTGKGLGRIALEFLEEHARRYQIHSLIAVICGENSQSIRLFEKVGYRRCAHYLEVGRKFGRLLDVVCYQKVLK